jgi:hypothetical protein
VEVLPRCRGAYDGKGDVRDLHDAATFAARRRLPGVWKPGHLNALVGLPPAQWALVRPEPLLERAEARGAIDGGRLQRPVGEPEHGTAPLALQTRTDGSETVVELVPAPRVAEDGPGLLDGDALRGLRARPLLVVPAALAGLLRRLRIERAADDPAVLRHGVSGVRERLPALGVLDPRDGPMDGLDVESLVRGDDSVRERVDPVHGDVQVDVLRVAMEAIQRLVLLEPELLEQDRDGVLDLLARGLLPLAPAQDVVRDGVTASRRLVGERDHLVLPPGEGLGLEVAPVLVQKLLLVLRVRDVGREVADVRRLALETGARRVPGNLLPDHGAFPGCTWSALSRSMKARICAIAAAVSLL